MNTVPSNQHVNLGDQVKLTAFVNTTNLSKIKFEWYKLNNQTMQDEALTCKLNFFLYLFKKYESFKFYLIKLKQI